MVISTQKKLCAASLGYSYPQIELPSEITKNSKETIHDTAIFSKLLLVMDNLSKHLTNFPKDFWILQMSLLWLNPPRKDHLVTNAWSGPKISVLTVKPPALIGPRYITEKFQTNFTQRKWEVTILDDYDSNMIEN